MHSSSRRLHPNRRPKCRNRNDSRRPFDAPIPYGDEPCSHALWPAMIAMPTLSLALFQSTPPDPYLHVPPLRCRAEPFLLCSPPSLTAPPQSSLSPQNCESLSRTHPQSLHM